MNINTLDLNLLRVFEAVLREGSITAAASRLSLTQPTMSNALNRLRQQFNDPLFVRTSGGMKPTAYALMLAEPLAEALRSVRDALELDLRFDPAVSTRTFRLVMTDIGELMFLPRLAAELGRIAPGISVLSAQMSRERYREALELGDADIAIGQLPDTHKDFRQQSLCDEPLICLMRRDHPTIGDTITLPQFLEARHLAIIHSSRGDTWVRKALGKNAHRRRIVLQVPHYVVVPMILAESDLIAVMPQAAALAFAGLGTLKFVPLPFKVPLIRVRQFWHERVHHDPGHRWLRDTLSQMFATRAA